MILIAGAVQTNSIDITSIYLALIPILGTIVVALVGFLINKRMEITKETNARKRQIYEDFLNVVTLTQIGDSINLLIDPSIEYPFKEVHATKLDLIKKYESIKLWGSKGVVEACFYFFDAQIKYNKDPKNVTQDEMKNYYYKIIEEMRKDLKMDSFSISKNNINNITYDRDDVIRVNRGNDVNPNPTTNDIPE